jgi:hypothetical protein
MKEDMARFGALLEGAHPTFCGAAVGQQGEFMAEAAGVKPQDFETESGSITSAQASVGAAAT